MTINSVSLTVSPYPTDVQSPWNQPVQEFKALKSALQSGDLSGAQTAFATLQKELQTPSQTIQADNTPGQGMRIGHGGKDLESLANALTSGDLSGAQQAFASLQQDLQATAGARRYNHRRPEDGATQASQASSSSESDTQISQGAKDLGALPSALASGDMSGAQQAFASLQQDLQSTKKAGQQQPQQTTTDTSTATTTTASATTSGHSKVRLGVQDFQALQTALSSGDLTGAQQAFAALQQDLQNMGRAKHHPHHHHHSNGSVGTTTPTGSTTTPTDTSTAPANSGTTPPASSAPSATAPETVGGALDVQA